MAKAITKYRIVCRHGEKTAIGFIEFDKSETLTPLVNRLNKIFPKRLYSIRAVSRTEKERLLELVK